MNKRILILAPHTDDGEFCAGGSISKFISEGDNVFYTAFTLAEESVPKPFPRDILHSEVKNATKVLGIKPENLMIYDFKVRRFAEHRQGILDELIILNREIQPDLVFMPCINDLHQDHSTIAKEGLRAFKHTSILSYEIPWNSITFTTSCFIVFNESHLNKKIVALNCYNSQKGKKYASKDFIRSLAVMRGTQIGVDYAEVFEVIRWVI